MNEFTEHIRMMMFFALAFLVLFIVAFYFKLTRLWLPSLMAIAILTFIIAILARGDNEIGRTD